MRIEDMPLRLATVFTKANNLLNSNIKATKIEEYTGINHSTIYRLRNHNRKISTLTMKSMLLLANYPNKGMVNKPGHRVDKIMYRYYLSSAALHYGIDFNEIKSKIYDVVSTFKNVSEAARRMHMSRSHISHMRSGLYNIYYQRVDVVAKLLNEWTRLVKLGRIKTTEKSNA